MKKEFLIALEINLFFLILCFVFGNPQFGALDDYFMARILEGAYSEDYNIHMVFVNVLYGYVLLPFYHLFPAVGWYYIGEIFSVFISFLAVSFIVIRKLGLWWGSLFATFFVASFSSDFYLVLQFTQCAAILSGAGMLSLIFVLENKNDQSEFKHKSLWMCVVGFVLLFWGSCMRWDAFLMGLPFLAIALLIKFRICWKNKICVIVCLLIGVCGAQLLREVDQLHYTSPEYQSFKEFQPYRVMLGDGSNYDMNAVYEDIEEQNLSSKNYLRLRDWFFYDKEVFSVENLKPFVKTITNHISNNSKEYLVNSSLSGIALLMSNPITWPWILGCLLLFVFNGKNNGYAWLSLFVLICLEAYLVDINRCVYRVETGLVFYASVFCFSFLKRIPEKKTNTAKMLFVMLLVGYSIYFWNTAEFTRDPTRGKKQSSVINDDEEDYKSLRGYIENSSDTTLFFVSMMPYMKFAKYGTQPWLSEPFGSWKKIVPSGYWTPYYPDVEKILSANHIENPVRDAVKDNIYVIGYRFDDLLQDHYYDSVSVTTVASFGEIAVEKYSVVQKDVSNE